ncbi:MAG: lipoprotein-releasing system ATP-binding protein LolD [Gammaproteobacteria bacterium]|nr:MAG: lipoprotein-releasing system ATP-binding protein LolD [Gammaproteobacteria bacterium]
MLQTKNLGKIYEMGEIKIPALKDINLDLKAGSFVALEGPSGSGKSTLLNICGLLDKQTTGELFFNDSNITDLTAKQITQIRRDKIGFIFQGFNLVPVMSVYDNVEYPLFLNNVSNKKRRLQTIDILKKVGVAEYAKHLPDKISGGQKQRVAIARALIKKPPLIIADEPTANLDTKTATDIIDLMHQMAAEYKTTFIIATHDKRMSQRCDKIIKLEDGALK